MMANIELIKSQENQRNADLVPIQRGYLQALYDSVNNHEKLTLDGKLLTTMDRVGEFLELTKV
jgi:hypothetical protein